MTRSARENFVTNPEVPAEGLESEHPVGTGNYIWTPATAERLPSRWLQSPWRDALRRRMLLAADALAVFVAAGWLAASHGVQEALWVPLFLPLWIVLAKIYGLYDRDHRALRHLTVDEVPGILLWAMTSTAGLALFYEAASLGSLSVRGAFSTWLIAAGAAFCFRALARWAWRRISPRERTLIVGSGKLAEATTRKLELFPDIHAELVEKRPALSAAELGERTNMLAGLDRIVVASEEIDEALIGALVAACRRQGLKLSVVPPVRGLFGTAVQLNHVADLAIVEYNTWEVGPSTLLLKRALDLIVATFSLVFLAPVFAVIAVAIKLDSRGPVIFSQWRAGQGGKAFRMYKFRTMTSNAEELLAELVPLHQLDEPMFKLADDPRVTGIGRILRRMSLDELPQLANVLLGHMSLVGPRPEQVEIVDLYSHEHQFRLKVKPGLTGPMQVYGRGALSFEERLSVEREYVENLSIARDLRLIGLTIVPLLTGRGAS